jgi:hypothetical protein
MRPSTVMVFTKQQEGCEILSGFSKERDRPITKIFLVKSLYELCLQEWYAMNIWDEIALAR